MTHDYLISLIRTAVGAALAWLASEAGIVLDSGTALTAGVVALAMAGYYGLVRATLPGSHRAHNDPINRVNLDEWDRPKLRKPQFKGPSWWWAAGGSNPEPTD